MTTGRFVCAVLLALADPAVRRADEARPVECRATDAVSAQPPSDPNADTFGQGPWYVNDDKTIWAGWDAVRMSSGKQGNKVYWIRPLGTQLALSGRRLDASAPLMKASIPCCYRTGFQPSRLSFPAEGCWEIAAVAGNNRLTFVTRVAPESARP